MKSKFLPKLALVAMTLNFSCKSVEATDSREKGSDNGNYYLTADELRRDPKIFLENREKTGRPVPSCQDLDHFNASQLQELNSMNTLDAPPFTGDQNRKASLSRSEADELYRRVSTNPVASLFAVSKYDPKNSGIGYCFGRAMTGHLEALFNMNVKNSSIRKLFAMGSLITGSTKWGWHVTTIVKSSEGGWWAIDPIYGSVCTVDQWYQWMLTRFNPSHDLVLLHDNAMRLGPSSDRYALRQINHPDYNNYFKDLLGIYKEKFRADGSKCPLPHR